MISAPAESPAAPSRPARRAAWVVGVLVSASMVAVATSSAGSTATGDERAGHAAHEAGAAQLARARDRSQAGDLLVQLTLDQRVGQLVMTAVPGARLTQADTHRLQATSIGGVILFSGNVRTTAQLRRLTGSLHALGPRDAAGSGPRTLISVDQEGGTVKRLPHSPPFRSHEQLGRRADVGVTRRTGRATGDALAAVGIDFNLAPVADIDNGRAHVMAGRSFGGRPGRVALHVEAFLLGLDAAGVAAAVKHYPGFGAAPRNSDDGRARIDRSLIQLDSVERVPFRRAIAADVDSVMVSHGIYTAIDRIRPASVSGAIYARLRDHDGFDGVAITDSLHAAGFAAGTRTPITGCVEAIAAGADIVLLTGTVVDAVRCQRLLLRGARTDPALRARVDESALRVLALKARRGLLISPTDS